MANSNRMIARQSPRNSLDDFPTPPWATRALSQYVLSDLGVSLGGKRILEPACGRGHMVRALQETGAKVIGSDIKDYRKGFIVDDFTAIVSAPHTANMDWVITNPPYKVADSFFHRAKVKSRIGVALLVRMNWLQGGERYHSIFSPEGTPPRVVGIFAGRIPFQRGRVISSASVFFQHVWAIWLWNQQDRTSHLETKVIWIPPEAKTELERSEDYK